MPTIVILATLAPIEPMLSTTKSQSVFMWAIILALIFVSASLYASDFQTQSHTTRSYVDFELTDVRVNESAGVLNVQVVRSGDYRQPASVEFQTVESEASEGSDYKGTGGTLTFKAGESFKTIALEIRSDEEVESPESFVLQITTADPNTQVERSSATVWIEDAPAAAAQPALEIIPNPDGSILLSWQSTRPCGLERTANPAHGLWESVNCTPVLKGDRFEVVQPAGGVFHAFRLRAD
jgi:hypothetical protein